MLYKYVFCFYEDHVRCISCTVRQWHWRLEEIWHKNNLISWNMFGGFTFLQTPPKSTKPRPVRLRSHWKDITWLIPFLLIPAKCLAEEFHENIRRFQIISKLLTRGFQNCMPIYHLHVDCLWILLFFMTVYLCYRKLKQP